MKYTKLLTYFPFYYDKYHKKLPALSLAGFQKIQRVLKKMNFKSNSILI